MFERFTDATRQVVIQAQVNARRLGHNYIGCEHLLLAAVAAGEPASVILRDHGLTPERVEAEILHVIGRGPATPAAMKDGMVPVILSALGASAASLRATILDRYRKAS